MSEIHTWVCFLLWISFSIQDRSPEVTVVCGVSKDCVLPCSFRPSSNQTVRWFRQDLLLYSSTADNGLDQRLSLHPALVSHGNATLTIRRSGLRDRGTYRCHVISSEGEHTAKVVVKVEAPIQGLSLDLSRLSGYEEMKCTVHNVYPAPRVTWETEPRTFEELRPITRKLSNQQGLYTVDSRLRRLDGHPELLYICRVSSSYGGPAWATSLRVREIRGSQGRDLTLPCRAPEHLNHPHLQWSFSSGEDPSPILTYDTDSGLSTSSPAWTNHVEVDKFRVEFGEGSLRLMDPRHSQHTGSFVCVFSTSHSTHTERNHVTIDDPVGERSVSEAPSYWWVAGLVIAMLVLVLVGVLAYLKVGGSRSKQRKEPEEGAELRLVKDSTEGSGPLTLSSTSRPSGLQSTSESS